MVSGAALTGRPTQLLHAALSSNSVHALRRRPTLPIATVLVVITLLYLFFHSGSRTTIHIPSRPAGPPKPLGPPPPVSDFPYPKLPPLSASTVDLHPVRKQIDEATAKFDEILRRQSKTLKEAVDEYQRRYGIPPPPNFDKWYQYAHQRNVVLIDEFDSILESLRPFWALSPDVIRSRARETLGFDNFMLGVLVRDGKITSRIDGWQLESTSGMMKNFVQWLPDMDLVFNVHDEPRVVVGHEDLTRLVETATKELLRISSTAGKYRNAWSPRPPDMSYEKQVPEVRTTRFNRFAHQPTWTNSRISCPPDSASRSMEEHPKDNVEAYSDSDISLISNHTAFTDICNSPSFQHTFGFFDRPNSFDIVHDLFPIFSQSKISSYQDILYPSPWYWFGKVTYRQSQDVQWGKKINQLYWRGSTTGGFSRDGGWRRQHRQQVVRNVNSNADTRYFEHPVGTENVQSSKWNLKEAARQVFAELFDVHFSHIGQCDDGDCAAQESFFGKAPQAPQEAAWRYKYLLDIDGNAFSGRFYAFLSSMSAVFKMAVFREWHDGDNWLRPWVHYVPLSLAGHEYAEVLRYFDREEEGQALIKQMADSSRAWAGKALRNDDLEVWFFRLLLEYGRLIDDDRDRIGFTMTPE